MAIGKNILLAFFFGSRNLSTFKKSILIANFDPKLGTEKVTINNKKGLPRVFYMTLKNNPAKFRFPTIL